MSLRNAQGLLGLWHALVAGYITVTLIATGAALRLDWDDAAALAAKRAETKPLLGATGGNSHDDVVDLRPATDRSGSTSDVHRNSTGSHQRTRSGRGSTSYRSSPRGSSGARGPQDLVDGFTQSPFLGVGASPSASRPLTGADGHRGGRNYDSFGGRDHRHGRGVVDDGDSSYGSSVRA